MKRDTSLRRRHFLQGAASITTGLALPTFVPATVFGAQAPSNRIVMGATWSRVPGDGGYAGLSEQIRFGSPVKTRYLKILQTGASDSWHWSIHELSVEFEESRP